MKINILTIVIVLFSYHYSQAQNTTEDRKAKQVAKREATVIRKDSLAKIPVGSYLSISIPKALTAFPRISLGYMTPLSDRWSIGGSAGIGFSGLPFTTNNIEDYSLWELRPEVIYYLGKGKKFTNYIGIELFYINSKETLLFDNFDPINDANGTVEIVQFDSADYERTKSGFVFNFGEYARLSEKLMLRTTFGVGMRFKDNVYSNVQNPTFTTFDINDSIIISDLNPRRNEGFDVGFEFNLDFRLIYKLD